MSIFISYRREGGLEVAKYLYENLIEDYNVFFDNASLRSGPFEPEIISNVKKCDDFLLIITEDTFDRCVNPGDWITKECMTALQNNKNIIPVFVNCTHCPKKLFEFSDLVKIDGFNGIKWAFSTDTIDKIKSFLKGNKRYKLFIANIDNRITLSESSKEQLKLLYVNFIRNNRRTVEVQLIMDNIDEIAELAMKNFLDAGYKEDSARHLGKQYVLRKFRNYSDILGKAIEHMLSDEMMYSVGAKKENIYLKTFGVDNCYIEDDNGLDIWLYTVFVWFEIIDEMLKELILDRYDHYGNLRKSYVGVDFILRTRFGEQLWSFLSFIEITDNNKKFLDAINNYIQADYFDMSSDVMIYSAYPDLFTNIGRMYKYEPEKYNKLKASYGIDKVFNLYYYVAGFH